MIIPIKTSEASAEIVLTKIKSKLNINIIGFGCNTHIIHNCVKTIFDSITTDIIVLVKKFWISSNIQSLCRTSESFLWLWRTRIEAYKVMPMSGGCHYVHPWIEYWKFTLHWSNSLCHNHVQKYWNNSLKTVRQNCG